MSGRLLRRLAARLPEPRRLLRPQAEPNASIRDPWPGDPDRGTRLMRGELAVGADIRPLGPDDWSVAASEASDEAAHGFVWLRDLRALGTDGARMRARLLISRWLETGFPDPLPRRPHIVGARIAAWLGHYDFFAASAGEGFRRLLLRRLVAEARMLAAEMPPPPHDARSLGALKGLAAAGAALPGRGAWAQKAARLLPDLIAAQAPADGGHPERSPVSQMVALRDLLELRALLQLAGTPQGSVLGSALAGAVERLAGGLAVLRHGDGGLALFNGASEEDPATIDAIAAQARRPARASAAAGFQRLQAGRTVLIVDAGSPPTPGLDRLAHAGTLSFELSVGRERLIVNCGSAMGGDPAWREALASTAAHSTLVIGDTNSSQLDGAARRAAGVEAAREEGNGAHWLELSHDGYRVPFGALHRRRLYMSETGEDIRGEDMVEGGHPLAFQLRFHLHPTVSAVLQDDTALLRLPGGALWRLRADAPHLSLEESLYLGTPERQETRHLLLAAGPDDAQGIKWALTKIG